MKIGKRFLAGACAFAMMFGTAALPQTAELFGSAARVYAETEGDFEYRVLDDGTLEISNYDGDDTEIVIPAEIKGKKVTSIGDWSFNSSKRLTSITIPDGVTSIGNYAFYYCTSLTSINIPDSVTSIGEGAFECCSSLLTSITVPAGVTSIGDMAFSGISNLESIYVDDNNTSFCSVDGVLYDYAKKTLVCCPPKKGNITIPDSVSRIGNGAFLSCTNLTEITIPDSVTSIGNSAFEKCENLTSIMIPDSVTSIDQHAFWQCTSLTSITIPDSLTNIGGYAFDATPWIDAMREISPLVIVNGILIDGHTCEGDVVIPEGVTSIGDGAFQSCINITSVIIPDGITSIGNKAFMSCWQLAEINIPDTVTSIGNMAFYMCASLTGITIPDSVTSIDDFAFGECHNLTDVTIPESVKYFGGGVFSATAWLDAQREKDPLVIVNGIVIDGKTCKGDVVIPEGVTSICYGAFSDCQLLENITLPESITSIGDYSLCNCKNLTSITVPKDVNFIGEKALGYLSYYLENSDIIYKLDGFKICCYRNTAGHQYAKDNGFAFELLDGEELVPGDADGDGASNMQDYALVQRFLAGWKIDIDKDACDLNRDGEVNMQDYALFQRMLAGWDIIIVA